MGEESKKLILLGAITNAHGIKGDVTIKPFGNDPHAINSYGPLTDKTGQNTFTILALRHGKKDLYVARIKEITDRNQAEKVKGTELYVELNKLPAPEEDEFYYHDLFGLDVKLENGDLFGTVKAVENFGAGDIIEILPKNSEKTIYFAFTKDIITHVAINEGYITLVPPVEEEITQEKAEAAYQDDATTPSEEEEESS